MTAQKAKWKTVWALCPFAPSQHFDGRWLLVDSSRRCDHFGELASHSQDLFAHMQRYLNAFEVNPQFSHEILRDANSVYLIERIQLFFISNHRGDYVFLL